MQINVELEKKMKASISVNELKDIRKMLLFNA